MAVQAPGKLHVHGWEERSRLVIPSLLALSASMGGVRGECVPRQEVVLTHESSGTWRWV